MVEKLSEREATQAFLNHFSSHAEELWEQTYTELTSFSGFRVNDRHAAALELTLAAIAVSLQAVKNIRGQDQFERITKWTIFLVDDYAVPKLKTYLLLCEKIEHSPVAALAYSALTSRLLENLLSENLSEIEGLFHIITMPLNNSLMQIAMTWSWKTLFEQRDIVPGTLSPFEDPRLDSRLTEFLEGASSRLYRELIEYHIKRSSSKHLSETLSEEIRAIPVYLGEHMEHFIEYSIRDLTTDKIFWESSNCRDAFERIISMAIEVLPLTGQIDNVDDSLAPENTGLAFQLFQTITVKLAWLASSQPSIRAFMGIRKGINQFLRYAYLVALVAISLLSIAFILVFN